MLFDFHVFLLMEVSRRQAAKGYKQPLEHEEKTQHLYASVMKALAKCLVCDPLKQAWISV